LDSICPRYRGKISSSLSKGLNRINLIPDWSGLKGGEKVLFDTRLVV
jgi:hypothetical protein